MLTRAAVVKLRLAEHRWAEVAEETSARDTINRVVSPAENSPDRRHRCAIVRTFRANILYTDTVHVRSHSLLVQCRLSRQQGAFRDLGSLGIAVADLHNNATSSRRDERRTPDKMLDHGIRKVLFAIYSALHPHLSATAIEVDNPFRHATSLLSRTTNKDRQKNSDKKWGNDRHTAELLQQHDVNSWSGFEF